MRILRIGWDKICLQAIYSFAPTPSPFRHLNGTVSVILPARSYLRHVFVSVSKICPRIWRFKNSSRLLHESGVRWLLAYNLPRQVTAS